MGAMICKSLISFYALGIRAQKKILMLMSDSMPDWIESDYDFLFHFFSSLAGCLGATIESEFTSYKLDCLQIEKSIALVAIKCIA